MKLLAAALLLSAAMAQPLGVMVPPHNWRYTVGDYTCTKAHCAVRYPLDEDTCSCGHSQIVDREIDSCMPHCGNTCHQCELLFPAQKKIDCGRQACTNEEWSALSNDCVQSDWGSWSECTKPCTDKFGPGLKYRHKSIIVPARGSGKQCDSEYERYDETECNLDQCTEPISCHDNPYCAGTMELCKNVQCAVVQHDVDGGDGDTIAATGCVDDGYGKTTCNENDVHFVPSNPDDPNCRGNLQWNDTQALKNNATHNICSGSWKRAAGKLHIRVTHMSWDPADRHTTHDFSEWSKPVDARDPTHSHTHPRTRENDHAKHFCKVHYPFGLRQPECKCMCMDEVAVKKRCNFDKTRCHLVASDALQQAIDVKFNNATYYQAPSIENPVGVNLNFPQASGLALSGNIQPKVYEHANTNDYSVIKSHQEHIYNVGDLAIAKMERANAIAD